MSKTIFLKKSLETELKNNERFNGISNIGIPLKNEETTHIYNSSGNYTSDHLGQFILSFSNETAWYYNKDLEITLSIGSKDGLIKPINLDEDDEYFLGMSGDNNVSIDIIDENKFLVKNIKTTVNLFINLNNGDTISWNINVLNKHSIDYNANFKIDYLRILNKTLEKNVKNEKVTLLTKELEIKNNQIKNLKENISNLNKNLQEKDFQLNNEKIANNTLNNVIKCKNKEIEEHIEKYNICNRINNEKINENMKLLTIIEQKNLLFKINKSNNEKFKKENADLKSKNADLKSKLEKLRNNYENILNRNLFYKEDIKKKNEILEKKYWELINNNKAKLNLEFKLKTEKHKFEKIDKNNQKLINDIAFIINNKDIYINNLKNNIFENIDLIKVQLSSIKYKYEKLSIENNKKIKKNKNFKIDLSAFEEEFKNKVLKRHIFILEKKLNKVVKNKKISEQTLSELTSQNKHLLKINHINKNNEKKLKENLEKAKIKLNKEVNYNKKNEEKLNLIKKNFFNHRDKEFKNYFTHFNI